MISPVSRSGVGDGEPGGGEEGEAGGGDARDADRQIAPLADDPWLDALPRDVRADQGKIQGTVHHPKAIQISDAHVDGIGPQVLHAHHHPLVQGGHLRARQPVEAQALLEPLAPVQQEGRCEPIHPGGGRIGGHPRRPAARPGGTTALFERSALLATVEEHQARPIRGREPGLKCALDGQLDGELPRLGGEGLGGHGGHRGAGEEHPHGGSLCQRVRCRATLGPCGKQKNDGW